MTGVTRRRLVQGLGVAAAALAAGDLLAGPTPARASGRRGLAGTRLDIARDDADPVTRATLEAFADTMIPGAKRHPGDHAIAGVSAGPGAVHAGAIELLYLPELGLALLLPELAALLNARAVTYAAGLGAPGPAHGPVPPFVALPFRDRVRLAERLCERDPDRTVWVALAMVVSLAFDTAAHRHTPEAVRSGHPGLAFLGFPEPGADGLWRFPRFSYGGRPAGPHPQTTPSGSPP